MRDLSARVDATETRSKRTRLLVRIGPVHRCGCVANAATAGDYFPAVPSNASLCPRLIFDAGSGARQHYPVV